MQFSHLALELPEDTDPSAQLSSVLRRTSGHWLVRNQPHSSHPYAWLHVTDGDHVQIPLIPYLTFVTDLPTFLLQLGVDYGVSLPRNKVAALHLVVSRPHFVEEQEQGVLSRIWIGAAARLE